MRDAGCRPYDVAAVCAVRSSLFENGGEFLHRQCLDDFMKITSPSVASASVSVSLRFVRPLLKPIMFSAVR